MAPGAAHITPAIQPGAVSPNQSNRTQRVQADTHYNLGPRNFSWPTRLLADMNCLAIQEGAPPSYEAAIASLPAPGAGGQHLPIGTALTTDTAVSVGSEEHAKMQAQVASLQYQVGLLTSLLRDTRAQMKQESKLGNDKLDLAKSYHKRFHDTNALLSESQAKVEKLEKRVEKLEGRNEKLENDHRMLRSDHGLLRMQHAFTAGKVRDLTADRDDALQLVEQWHVKIKHLQERQEEMERELALWKAEQTGNERGRRRV